MAELIWAGNAPTQAVSSDANSYRAWWPATGRALELDEYPLMQALARDETLVGIELNIRRLDGSSGTVLVSAAPVHDAGGRLVGGVVVNQDVTGLRSLEARQLEYLTQVEVQRQLLQQREMERQQIARDIHDGPVQGLISLMFPVQTAIAISDDPAVKDVLSGIQNELQRLTSELRGVCNELRPPILARFGLEKAIQASVDSLRIKHPALHFATELSQDDQTLPDPVRLALFRIYQESMNNVIRHSGATQILVRLAIDATSVRLEVTDDGRGFPAPEDWLQLVRQGHLGLVGMRERAEAAGGTLCITSQPGQGTRLQVSLPRPTSS
jgi:signal transduction histidine kinase